MEIRKHIKYAKYLSIPAIFLFAFMASAYSVTNFMTLKFAIRITILMLFVYGGAVFLIRKRIITWQGPGEKRSNKITKPGLEFRLGCCGIILLVWVTYSFRLYSNVRWSENVQQAVLLKFSPDKEFYEAQVREKTGYNTEEIKEVAARLVEDSWSVSKLTLAYAMIIVNKPKKAFMLLSGIVGKDKAHAEYSIANMYLYGFGVVKDESKAYEMFHNQAENGVTESMVNLGMMNQAGVGVNQDLASAKYWYELAAKLGSAEARNNLGLLYAKGIGVKRDLYKSFELFKLSAAQNIDAALVNLGNSFHSGLGVKENQDSAFFYYQKAAKRGYPPGLEALGTMYYSGNGVPKNVEMAKSLYLKAKELGYNRVILKLVLIYTLEGNLQMCESVLREGSKKGDLFCESLLGDFLVRYRTGKKVNEGVQILKNLAIEKKYAPGQYLYGLQLIRGVHIERNIPKSREFLKLAAHSGYPQAMLHYGDMLCIGVGGPLLMNEGLYWRNKGKHSKLSEWLYPNPVGIDVQHNDLIKEVEKNFK